MENEEELKPLRTREGYETYQSLTFSELSDNSFLKYLSALKIENNVILADIPLKWLDIDIDNV